MKNNSPSAAVVLIACAALTLFAFNANAQCKGFAKEQIGTLTPYIYSGKTNSTILTPGDHSELTLTFYSGETYRIIMRSAETQGNITFTIKDADGKLVYKSSNTPNNGFYDFTSETTQMLTIEMIAADPEVQTAEAPSQCVVVLVGQKESN